MRPAIDDLLAATGGAASRGELLRVVTRNQLDDEVARGRLVAVFPRAYCRPWDADQVAVRERAAVASVGAPAALSHLSALRRHGLPSPVEHPIHVLVSAARHPSGRPGELVVHRTRVRTATTRVDGVPTVTASLAIVQSFPLLPLADRRAPAIEAVRRGLVRPDQLATSCARGGPGTTVLRELADQLRSGCDSELELWGYLDVFAVPGLDHGVRQLWVSTPAGRFQLDLGYRDERVAVEMDGRRFHSSAAHRERDMRRDAALASIGWMTLRFSHTRLHRDVEGCRRDTMATLRSRGPRARV